MLSDGNISESSIASMQQSFFFFNFQINLQVENTFQKASNGQNQKITSKR